MLLYIDLNNDGYESLEAAKGQDKGVDGGSEKVVDGVGREKISTCFEDRMTVYFLAYEMWEVREKDVSGESVMTPGQKEFWWMVVPVAVMGKLKEEHALWAGYKGSVWSFGMTQ